MALPISAAGPGPTGPHTWWRLPRWRPTGTPLRPVTVRGTWAPQGLSSPTPVARPPSPVFRTGRQLLLSWELLGSSLSPWEPGSRVGGVRGARLRLLERGTPPASALEEGSRRGPLTALPDRQTIDAADQEAANVASFILEAHADRAWRAGHGRSCLGSTPLGWPGLLSVRPSIQRPGPPALTEGQPPRAADPQLHRGDRPGPPRASDEGGFTSELQLYFPRC